MSYRPLSAPAVVWSLRWPRYSSARALLSMSMAMSCPRRLSIDSRKDAIPGAISSRDSIALLGRQGLMTAPTPLDTLAITWVMAHLAGAKSREPDAAARAGGRATMGTSARGTEGCLAPRAVLGHAWLFLGTVAPPVIVYQGDNIEQHSKCQNHPEGIEFHVRSLCVPRRQ
jgi:hypothetical protein